MVDIKTRICRKCGGQVVPKEVKKNSRVLSISLIVIGVIISLTIIGSLIGIPLVIAGVKIGSASKNIRVCEKCGTVQEN